MPDIRDCQPMDYPMRGIETTCCAVVTTVSTEAYTAEHTSQVLLQELQPTRSHSLSILSAGRQRVCWQTLGQTCSRGDPGSAICVQRLDDSLNSAIHTRYRSLLRSSSMHEPRDPPSEVVNYFLTHGSIPKRIIQVGKSQTQKTKDGSTRSEAQQAVENDSYRFKCIT